MTWYDLSVFYFNNQNQLNVNSKTFTLPSGTTTFTQRFQGKGFINRVHLDTNKNEIISVSLNIDGRIIDVISASGVYYGITIINIFGGNGTIFYPNIIASYNLLFSGNKITSSSTEGIVIGLFYPLIFERYFEININRQKPHNYDKDLEVNYITLK